MQNKITLSPFNSLQLFGHDNLFDNLHTLINTNKLPNTLLFSGDKGSGKFTLINHLLMNFFDSNNYDIKKKKITKSIIYKKIITGTFQNIIYLNNTVEKKIKIDEIRELKKKLFTTCLNSLPRFIILDNLETFNINCINALLKILEEPSVNNFFILIDNKNKDLVKTILSRCTKIQINLSKIEREKISKLLLDQTGNESIINIQNSNLTPGSYLKFNNLCISNNIFNDMNYIEKINILLQLFKKTKNIDLIDMAIFFTDQYYYEKSVKEVNNVCFYSNAKIKTINEINNFVLYNMNIRPILNSIITNTEYDR